MRKVSLLVLIILMISMVTTDFTLAKSKPSGKVERSRNPIRWMMGEHKIKVLKDLDYSGENDGCRMLDLYLPIGVKSPPLVVFIHGGAFVSGDKSRGKSYCSLFASWGFACASVNYRLSPRYKWPTHIEDVKQSVKWLVKNSKKYGIDASKIVAMGTSAGGHLASMLGLMNTDEYKIVGVIDMFGPTYIDESEDGKARNLMVKLFGVNYKENEELVESFVVLNYVDENDPPFLIVHGEKDEVVPLKHSLLLEEKLKKFGVDVKLVVVKNAGHGLIPVDRGKNVKPSLREILKMEIEFLRRRLCSK